DDARPHAPVGEVETGPFAGDPEGGDRGGVGGVVLGALPSGGQDQGSRGAGERLARELQRPAVRLDRGPVASHQVVGVGKVSVSPTWPRRQAGPPSGGRTGNGSTIPHRAWTDVCAGRSTTCAPSWRPIPRAEVALTSRP